MVADVDTFLMAACEKGNLDEVLAALDAGADPNATNVASKLAHMQGAALMRAAKHGYLEIARALLQRGADVARQDYLFGTALHFAASQGHVAIARLLIEWGANPDTPDRYGRTALHEAASNLKQDVVRFLVDVGANMDARDMLDTAPL